jgi:hypothetical protein
MIYYFIYETTNIVNLKRYRGIHKTSKIEDGYLGSGTVLLNAIEKYGKQNFKREILEFYSKIFKDVASQFPLLFTDFIKYKI